MKGLLSLRTKRATYKWCYHNHIHSFSPPSLASQKKDLSLLHIFYIACCISKKEFITEDIFCGYISVFISTTIATTRALNNKGEWNLKWRLKIKILNSRLHHLISFSWTFVSHLTDCGAQKYIKTTIAWLAIILYYT